MQDLIGKIHNIYYLFFLNLIMVLQYKLKIQKRWKDYPGKDKLEKLKISISKCDFRLLTENKEKVLSEGNYKKVLRRFRQIEFFKRFKGR